MRFVLFFSRGTSLTIWKTSGLIDREVEPYKILSGQNYSVAFLTYGREEDKQFADELNPITILYNRWNLPIDIFSLLAPILYRKQFKQADIYKTNQINGWWSAGLAKLLYRKPLLVRCGYLLSMNQEQKWKNYSLLRIKAVSFLEKFAFKYADKIVVTTPQMKAEAIRRYKLYPEKITVIPNFVNVDIFKPMPEVEKVSGRICFIGRFTGQKNIHLLMEAVAQMKGISLLLVGDGPLKPELKEKAGQYNINVDFMGKVPHRSLPALLNACEAFVLPSGWEGMPKALIEAMACGLPVIGTDAPGIRDVIEHNKTGLLCNQTAHDIRGAVKTILSDNVLARKLGTNARDYIVNNFSLQATIEKEIDLFESI